MDTTTTAIVTVIVVIAVAAVVHHFLWHWRWHNWPLVSGQPFRDFALKEVKDGDGGTMWRASCYYRFTPLDSDQSYTGEFTRNFDDRVEAEGFVEQLPKMELEVVYDPENPLNSRARAPKWGNLSIVQE